MLPSLSQIIDVLKNSSTPIDMEMGLSLWLKDLDSFIVGLLFQRLDKELYATYYEKGWRIDRIESRTIQFIFGEVRFERRRLRKKGEKSFLPLDEALGLEKRKRYSLNVRKKIAQMGSQMPFRQAEKGLRICSPISASHTTIHSITQEIGGKVQTYLSKRPSRKEKRRRVSHVFIEGDGLHIAGRQSDKPVIHRVLVHEGVKADKKRHELIEPMAFFSVKSSHEAFEQAAVYLDQTYDLKQSIVISNSDGGSGYEADRFEAIIGMCRRHEHFRDKFHVHRKIKTRLSFDKPMMNRLTQAVRAYEWKRVERILATAQSRIVDVPETVTVGRMEEIRKLHAYLRRNWPYVKGFYERDLSIDRGVGVCETGHRFYSYRMKRQGRSWTTKGAEHVGALLTAERNSELDTALKSEVDEHVEPLGKELKGAVREALKKSKTDTLRVKTGKLTNYASTSSFTGLLTKMFG